MIRRWLQRWFGDPEPAVSPLPPHVANLKLNMSLIALHIANADRPDERTKVGYVLQKPEGQK